MTCVEGFLRSFGRFLSPARIVDRDAVRINVAPNLFDHVSAFREELQVGVFVKKRRVFLLLVVELRRAAAGVFEVGFGEEAGHSGDASTYCDKYPCFMDLALLFNSKVPFMQAPNQILSSKWSNIRK